MAHDGPSLDPLIDSMDRPTRRVALFALICALGTALGLFAWRRNELVAGVDGCLVFLGAFLLGLAALGLEGTLREKEAAAKQRMGEGLAAPSTLRGRVLWGLAGLASLGGAVVVAALAS